MQIWFSRRNWWLRRDIPLMQKFLWSISCWGYITQSFATPVFLAIPIVFPLLGCDSDLAS